MPADLIDVDQPHCIEEVDSDLNTIVDAHGRDVLRRRDPRLVAVEAADVLVDPEGPASAAGVRVELEGALIRLTVGIIRITIGMVQRVLALVGVAVRHLRAPVHVKARDARDQDPVDADAGLRHVHRRPVCTCILQMQRVAVILLEAHVDLREDLVKRLVVDDEPQRADLEASYERSAEEEGGDYRQHAGLHEHQGVLAALANGRVSSGGLLQQRCEPVCRLVRNDLIHLVRVLHRFIILALQAELLDQAFAVRDADVNGG
mmetsp:Transcript_31576/g.83621  ORF Transcript_31576/g.83621 Transcript_31576/m.83621 type:complete len:261 (+) Transcript_31576:528-1310(+)